MKAVITIILFISFVSADSNDQLRSKCEGVVNQVMGGMSQRMDSLPPKDDQSLLGQVVKDSQSHSRDKLIDDCMKSNERTMTFLSEDASAKDRVSSEQILIQSADLAQPASSGKRVARSPGGLSDEKTPTPDVIEMVKDLRNQTAARLNVPELDTFEVISYKSQVVAGMNYFVKTRIGKDKYVVLRIYRNLRRKTSLAGIQEGISIDDPITYF